MQLEILEYDFLTIRPALSVLHSSGGLAVRVGAQAGFATSRTLGCAQAGFATSRTLGCAQVGFATSWTLGLGLGFGIDFGTIAIDLNQYVITSNIWCVAAWTDG